MEEADKIRLADLLQPLLHRIKLEAVPPGILERRVEAMGLLSPKELLEVTTSLSEEASLQTCLL